MKRILTWALLVGLFLPGSLLAQDKMALKKKESLGLAGWVVMYDPENASLADFEKHADQVDRAYFAWYMLDSQGMPVLRPEVTQALKDRALAAARKGQCQPWLNVTNLQYSYSDIEANTKSVSMFFFDGDLNKRHIDALVSLAKKDGLEGIQIDYVVAGPSFWRRYRRAFTSFMNNLHDACKKNGLLTGVEVIGNARYLVDYLPEAQFNYTALRDSVDEMVMTPIYRGHGAHGSPGFIDTLPLAEIYTKYMTHVIKSSKIEMIAIANGYDWVGVSGKELSSADFQALVEKNHVVPDRDTLTSQELTFDYPPDHEVWFRDAKANEYFVDLAKRYKTTGISLYHFGSEGADFWDMWKRANSTPQETAALGASPMRKAPKALKTLEIFTNRVRASYFYTYGNNPNDPDAPTGSNYAAIEKGGKYWVDFILEGDTWSGMGIGINLVNLKPYLEHGALQFLVKGQHGGEHFPIGFSCSVGLKPEERLTLDCVVPVENYCEVTTNWQLVTIPLSDFPIGGHSWDEELAENGTEPFRWDSVDTFISATGPQADQFIQFSISDVRVIPYYDPLSIKKRNNSESEAYKNRVGKPEKE